MTTDELETHAIAMLQKEFDEKVKPDIIKWMKDNHCVKLENSMGSALFTFKDGRKLLDDEIEGIAEGSIRFYETYIDMLITKNSVCYWINYNIEL